MALMSGTLVRHAESGLAVATGNEVTPIVWPFGYTARIEIDRAVLVDESGRTVAREGDEIATGGGFAADDAFFTACGGVTVTKSGS